MFSCLKTVRFIALLVFVMSLVNAGFTSAHEGESHAKKGLHFSHPLITESPSPDTKIGLDYFFMNVEGYHGEDEED